MDNRLKFKFVVKRQRVHGKLHKNSNYVLFYCAVIITYNCMSLLMIFIHSMNDRCPTHTVNENCKRVPVCKIFSKLFLLLTQLHTYLFSSFHSQFSCSLSTLSTFSYQCRYRFSLSYTQNLKHLQLNFSKWPLLPKIFTLLDSPL